jgi:hypothetical protein
MNEELEKFENDSEKNQKGENRLIIDFTTRTGCPTSKQLNIDNIKYKKKVNPDSASKTREVDLRKRLKSIKDSKKTGDLF